MQNSQKASNKQSICFKGPRQHGSRDALGLMHMSN